MKPMLLAFATALGLAVVADYGLDYAGFSASEQASGAAVRIE